MYKLVLASSSPNRKALLSSLNLKFKIHLPTCDEEKIICESSLDLTKKRAIAKIESIAMCYQNEKVVLIGSDTVIDVNGKTIGKPKTEEDVKKIFSLYSGNFHSVISSIACLNTYTKDMFSSTSISSVFFKKLNDNDIETYIKTKDWIGVAGGYKIQGIASYFIEKIEGSYPGIVGFPLCEFHNILKKILPQEDINSIMFGIR